MTTRIEMDFRTPEKQACRTGSCILHPLLPAEIQIQARSEDMRSRIWSPELMTYVSSLMLNIPECALNQRAASTLWSYATVFLGAFSTGSRLHPNLSLSPLA